MAEKACGFEALSLEDLKLKQDARKLKLASLVATTNAEKAMFRQRASAVRTMEVIKMLVLARLRGNTTPEDADREIVLLRTLWRENDKTNAFLRMAERVGYNKAERQCAMDQDDTELSEWNAKCTVRHWSCRSPSSERAGAQAPSAHPPGCCFLDFSPGPAS